jgi:integrase
LEKAPKHLHLPLLLALWTGQRQGDLLRLTWGQYDGRHIRLRQSKGGKRVTVPCGEPLCTALDSAPRRQALILLTSYDRPWTEDGFRSSWGKACDKAGTPTELTYHDMRGSAVTRLALAECSVPEIATFTGHSLKDVEAILDAHYLGRDVGMAVALLSSSKREQKAPNRAATGPVKRRQRRAKSLILVG